MKKVAYFRDGLCPQLVVRETVENGVATVEHWDYKDKKWVPDADAWETVDDQRGNWRLDAESVNDYIDEMMQRFPWLAECNIHPSEDTAERKVTIE